MSELKTKCYNCKFMGNQFKIADINHHHCEEPTQFTKEQWDTGDFSPWDTLKKFSDTCNKYEPKKQIK